MRLSVLPNSSHTIFHLRTEYYYVLSRFTTRNEISLTNLATKNNNGFLTFQQTSSREPRSIIPKLSDDLPLPSNWFSIILFGFVANTGPPGALGMAQPQTTLHPHVSHFNDPDFMHSANLELSLLARPQIASPNRPLATRLPCSRPL